MNRPYGESYNFAARFLYYGKQTNSLPQRGKVADVSAKQIYDRLRSSRMTDEVLLTIIVDKNRFSALRTPHPPPQAAVPLPLEGKAKLGRRLVLHR